MARAPDGVGIREMTAEDVASVVALDRRTQGDYPGGLATRHAPLQLSDAAPQPKRAAFLAANAELGALAVTYVDIDSGRAETDFTVVDSRWRGRGLAGAVKALALLTLSERGVHSFRTGGSDENVAIIAVNEEIGRASCRERV